MFDILKLIPLFTLYSQKVTLSNVVGGVLPLLDENENPSFGREEKCEILERVFFGGKHLEECTFDENFREEVEEELLQGNIG